jgi:hypothetical protein
LVGDEKVDLFGKACGVGRGGAEQADEGAVVAGAGTVIEVFVRGVGERGEGGIGLLVPRLCAVP